MNFLLELCKHKGNVGIHVSCCFCCTTAASLIASRHSSPSFRKESTAMPPLVNVRLPVA